MTQNLVFFNIPCPKIFQPVTLGMDEKSRTWTPNFEFNVVLSKLVCAEVSKTTTASKRVFYKTVNDQNPMLTKEVHDQGKSSLLIICPHSKHMPSQRPISKY